MALGLLSKGLLNSIKLIGDFVQATELQLAHIEDGGRGDLPSCPSSSESRVKSTLQVLLDTAGTRSRESFVAVTS